MTMTYRHDATGQTLEIEADSRAACLTRLHTLLVDEWPGTDREDWTLVAIDGESCDYRGEPVAQE